MTMILTVEDCKNATVKKKVNWLHWFHTNMVNSSNLSVHLMQDKCKNKINKVYSFWK